MDTKEIQIGREKIRKSINAVSQRMGELSGQIDAAEKVAVQARTDYDQHIDDGDRAAANEALDKIKPLRQKAAELRAERAKLGDTVPELTNAWQELYREAAELLPEANRKLKEAERKRNDMSVLVTQVSGLKASIDNLARQCAKNR